ncbi:MOSC domain-containing protein [Chitinophagaceae bacterium LB-8]|uniref:MOSC domain-containing protein n=1 Tax=Paraflavisolibacter caeni TaxID=2982496 RepID=A0A9X3BJ27_9BACT|nr:MOSC N-terminal beta barrel domain-containing protein [Paraflavisolibacter caeni]MCU7550763.1 MOSC domain-containing protein [Paraflavisolibacter caeni]
MLQVSEIFIYPIKSLGGISLSSAVVTDRGLQYDRRWMLVDEQGEFMTQRTNAEMALLQVEVVEGGLRVYHKKNNASIVISFAPQTGETTLVQVWGDRCRAKVVGHDVDNWFSDMLSAKCRLVYMPETTRRQVDRRYAKNREITSFSDGYPFLVIGQASLDDLNNRLKEKLPMNRFRPNIVFTGGQPFEEDQWSHFVIHDIHFYGVKLCSRCVVTTINQDEGKAGKEPLKTLATYRLSNNNIYFGQNLLHQGEGILQVGDSIDVIERKPAKQFIVSNL